MLHSNRTAGSTTQAAFGNGNDTNASTSASATAWSQTLSKTLRKYWGHSRLRQHQEEVCRTILQKRDAFVIMSTGGGKSLLYQLPTMMLVETGHASTALVISPLLSLINDQIDALRAMGISALSIGAETTIEEERKAMLGEYCILFATPEKILGWEHGLQALARSRVTIACVVVDEAHMVSEWGHDFRTSYRRLNNLRDIFMKASPAPHNFKVPMLALTATAVSAVQHDVISNLKMNQPLIIRGTVNRPNLKYFVVNRVDMSCLNRLLIFRYKNWTKDGSSKDCGRYATLVYVNTRKEVEDIQQYINESQTMLQGGITAVKYHAGMTMTERLEAYQQFMSGRVPVIIATVAFGMGINKPDIRMVVNFGMPNSMENFHQMTGRAGRDGQEAECILMYHRSDITKCRTLLDVSSTSGGGLQSRQHRENIKRIETIASFCRDLKTCRRKFLLEYFEEFLQTPFPQPHCCDLCDDALRLRENKATNNKADIAVDRCTTSGCRGSVATGSNTENAMPNEINLGHEVLLLLLTIHACAGHHGIGTIAGILVGSHDQRTQRIQGYTSLPTFGKGSAQSREFWKEFGHQLVDVEKLLSTEAMRGAGFSYDRYFLSPQGKSFIQANVLHAGSPRNIDYIVNPTPGVWRTLNPSAKFQHIVRNRSQANAASKVTGSLSMLDTMTARVEVGVDAPLSLEPNEGHPADVENRQLNAMRPIGDSCAAYCNLHNPSPPFNLTLNLGPEAVLLMYTIQYCGEFYGWAVPISVLLGRHDHSVQRVFGYDDAPTFGLGKLQSQDWWKILGSYLVDSGFVITTPIKYSACMYSLSSSGRELVGEHEHAISSYPQIAVDLRINSPSFSSQLMDAMNSSTRAQIHARSHQNCVGQYQHVASGPASRFVPPRVEEENSAGQVLSLPQWQESDYDRQLRDILAPQLISRAPSVNLYKPNYDAESVSSDDHESIASDEHQTQLDVLAGSIEIELSDQKPEQCKTHDEVGTAEDNNAPREDSSYEITVVDAEHSSPSTVKRQRLLDGVAEESFNSISRSSSLNAGTSNAAKKGSAGMKALIMKRHGLGSFVKSSRR